MIPCIDIDKPGSARALHHAFTTVGFAYVQGLPTSGGPFERVLAAAESFFALPDAVLSQSAAYDLGTNTGFERFLESFQPGTPFDLHEAMTWGPNRPHAEIWPTAYHQEAAYAWTQSCQDSMIIMLTLLEEALGLPLGSLVSQHTNSTTSTLRWIHYPRWQDAVLPGQTRGGAHTDIGTLTLLWQNDVPGLEVKTRQGDWIAAPPRSGACLVNVGDLLQRWTNDIYVSTRHRVANTDLDRARYSFPYFIHPRPEIMIDSLVGESRYAAVNARQYFDDRLKKSYAQLPQ